MRHVAGLASHASLVLKRLNYLPGRIFDHSQHAPIPIAASSGLPPMASKFHEDRLFGPL